ncbi:hypothetical protein BO70DRAFT_356931 [Aspergillus heteromorphus CBS 117.55]|uniref:Uncharacterized protein n=1 Tax=Aspergillus heteromorphus CBS 117.55 TaxID=1448321 RepID=A0A317UR95_9EURO|nr:uncharacterized protein BO70DRAFT_356931 [Aspergillus heteromorphus CBS 117.55]PWY64543.1 hypothetical protein BO70DRAFT_356931 [Aspergillus heteromorphus CBS 117.55]
MAWERYSVFALHHGRTIGLVYRKAPVHHHYSNLAPVQHANNIESFQHGRWIIHRSELSLWAEGFFGGQWTSPLDQVRLTPSHLLPGRLVVPYFAKVFGGYSHIAISRISKAIYGVYTEPEADVAWLKACGGWLEWRNFSPVVKDHLRIIIRTYNIIY